MGEWLLEDFVSQIVLDDLSFHFEAPHVQVFEGVSQVLHTTWRTALVGRNGRGKTTILRLLRGELVPTGGRVHMPCVTGYFPYEPLSKEGSTRDVIREAIAPFSAWEAEMEVLLGAGDPISLTRYGEIAETFEKLGGYRIEGVIEKEFGALGMAPELLDRPFGTLSGGEQTRALIVALFARPDRFPLLDEPTNHLDMAGREKLGAYLARQAGFILVSHDRHVLELCADHVVSLNRSDVRVHKGSFGDWECQMAREEEQERRSRANLQREIRSLERAARERRDWSNAKEKEKRGAFDKGRIGHLAAKQMKRALGIERRSTQKIAEKESLLKNAEKHRRLKLVAATGTPKTLLRVSEVSIGLTNVPLVTELTFAIAVGERVAIIGPNGCGKTTLLRTITGALEPLEGEVGLSPRLVRACAYQTPLWRTGALRDHLTRAEIGETHFRSVMGCFGVHGELFERPLESFSQGQLKKVDLCRSFVAPAHLLIWDEPMNYIDLMSREMIEDVILEQQPSMLFVEHDRRFVERVATDIIELCP